MLPEIKKYLPEKASDVTREDVYRNAIFKKIKRILKEKYPSNPKEVKKEYREFALEYLKRCVMFRVSDSDDYMCAEIIFVLNVENSNTKFKMVTSSARNGTPIKKRLKDDDDRRLYKELVKLQTIFSGFEIMSSDPREYMLGTQTEPTPEIVEVCKLIEEAYNESKYLVQIMKDGEVVENIRIDCYEDAFSNQRYVYKKYPNVIVKVIDRQADEIIAYFDSNEK